jgi:hypothetical protein
MTTNTHRAAALSDRSLHLALQQARPGGAIQFHLYEELEARKAARDAIDEDGSDAYVRHLELQGYDEARLQEEMEAQMGIY